MSKRALRRICGGVESMGIRGFAVFALIIGCTFWGLDSHATSFGLSAQPHSPKVVHPENSGQAPNDEGGRRNSLNILLHLAADEVNSDIAFLGRTRFEIDEQDHTFLLDLSPVPRRAVLSETDRYAVVLEALIRVESLQRDFRKAVPNNQFWVKPLDAVQGVVKWCSDKIDNTDSAETQQACSSNIEEQFKNLNASVRGYAAAHKLMLKPAPQERGLAIGYRVQVKIDPPRARVRTMTALEYKKCLSFKTLLDDQWNDLLDGDNEMIGRYHYLADWPSELNGPEEGNFEIRQPTTLTFRPKQK